MEEKCQAGPKLVFACSGAADVGEISDRAARGIARDGAGRMFCLAGIGGRVQGIIDSTAAAGAVLAIDGCGVECAKKSLEAAGIDGFMHLSLAGLGLAKGKSPATQASVDMVAKAGADMLRGGCCKS